MKTPDDLLRCPRCEFELEPDLTRQDVQPRVCLVEHGVFLETREMPAFFDERALEQVRLGLLDAKEADLECPHCDVPMRRLVVRGPAHVPAHRRVVEVDACMGCGGAWFDAGEAETLLGRGLPQREWGGGGWDNVFHGVLEILRLRPPRA